MESGLLEFVVKQMWMAATHRDVCLTGAAIVIVRGDSVFGVQPYGDPFIGIDLTFAAAFPFDAIVVTATGVARTFSRSDDGDVVVDPDSEFEIVVSCGYDGSQLLSYLRPGPGQEPVLDEGGDGQLVDALVSGWQLAQMRRG